MRWDGRWPRIALSFATSLSSLSEFSELFHALRNIISVLLHRRTISFCHVPKTRRLLLTSDFGNGASGLRVERCDLPQQSDVARNSTYVVNYEILKACEKRVALVLQNKSVHTCEGDSLNIVSHNNEHDNHFKVGPAKVRVYGSRSGGPSLISTKECKT